jgi:hypothetical protein
MSRPARQVQICDKSAHEPRLAHTRGQSEAQRGELSFKVGNLRIGGTDRFEVRLEVHCHPNFVQHLLTKEGVVRRPPEAAPGTLV